MLRVLQDKEVRPLGETKSRRVDVRIMASTNQDLRVKIDEKLFREDLYYRLNVISLEMPPLRERPEDIPLLTEHFLRKCAEDAGEDYRRISAELTDRLVQYQWPGNVRELENLVRRAMILSQGPEIGVEDVAWDGDDDTACLVSDEVKSLPYKEAKRVVLERFNHEYVAHLLTRNSGNVTRAARECGLERQALQQVMRRYGIKSKDFLDQAGGSDR